MLKLVRADVADHARPAVVLAHDRKPAVLVPGDHERLQLVAQTVHGIVLLNVDNFDVAVGLKDEDGRLVCAMSLRI